MQPVKGYEPVLGSESPSLLDLAVQLSPTVAPQINCAWCLVEQGQPLGTGSHGICNTHAEQIIQQSRARRALKSQSKQRSASTLAKDNVTWQ